MSKMIPGDIAIERALIRCTLDGKPIRVKPIQFFGIDNAVVYKRIIELIEEGYKPELILLQLRLREAGEYELIGGDTYWALLQDTEYTVDNYDEYARIIKETAYRRKAIELAKEVAEKSYTELVDLKLVAEELEEVESDDVAQVWARARNSQDLLETTPPPVGWIVEGMMEPDALVVTYGDTGIGKTFLSMHRAYCIASGKRYFGRACKPMRVLYLDAENGESLIHERVHLIGGHPNLTYLSFPGYKLDDKRFVELVKRSEAEIVFLDPLMYFQVGDENKIEDVTPQLEVLRTLSHELGVAFDVTHHENRAGSYRGSSGLADTCTLLLHLKLSEDHEPLDDETVLTVVAEKQRRTHIKRNDTMAWRVENGQFLCGSWAEMGIDALSRLIKACEKLYHEDGVWPAKTRLTQAKDLHKMSEKKANTVLAEALGDNRLLCKPGRSNRQEISIPGYQVNFSSDEIPF